jgi:glycosyltransferase involved in cell wall biosynthesis
MSSPLPSTPGSSRQERVAPLPEGAAPELTVAICTRDRRDSLLVTLASIAEQRWDGAWEVLVVDNGGTEELAAAIDALRPTFPVPLRLEREERPGLSHARNRALEVARGRTITFIDDDVTCLSGWLSSLGEAFRDPGLVVAGGPIRPVLPSGADPWLASVLSSEVGGPASRYEFGDEPAEIVRGGPVPAPFGANMSVRRDAARAAGGFDPRLGWGRRMIPAEEYEFFERVLGSGARARYLPSAVVLHRITRERTRKDYWLRWHRGLGRSMVLIRPPATWWHRLGKLLRYAQRALGAELARRRARRRKDFPAEVSALRLREIAIGRSLELLGR